MKKIFKFLFGKTFTGEQFVDSFIANLFGIQMFRYISGKILYKVKYFFHNNKNILLDKSGYIAIEDFLSEEEFFDLQKEFNLAIKDENFSKKYNDYGEGVEAVHVYLDDKIKLKYPMLYKFYKNERINNLFINNELKKKLNIVVKLEELKSKVNSAMDKSKNFHYDTYYNTFKGWFYLQDVTLEQGPLTYVEGSHKFSIRRIFDEWVASVRFSLCKNKKDWTYGVRSNYDYYNSISKKLIFKKNTFIFANTHALHRRGDATSETTRNTIHFYTRENPFKLLLN
jgi:hypothetical protein